MYHLEERTTTNILLSELQTKKERLVIQLHTVKHHQHNHGWNRQRQGPEKGYMYIVNVHYHFRECTSDYSHT